LKVTVPSPLVLYGFWNADYSTAAYSDPFAMFADAAEVGRSEIEELVSLGCDYIQATRRSWPRWWTRGSAIGRRPRGCRRRGC
jgi:methionine synthase II (cobalamin-independent)